MKPLLTKKELKSKLLATATMDELFDLTTGDEGCTIFKAPCFPADEDRYEKIIYIPDMELNELPHTDEMVWAEDIENILDCCYTANDFLELTKGNEYHAAALFDCCTWEHPSDLLEGMDWNDCEGCVYESDFPSSAHCQGCSRMYTDHYCAKEG